MQSPSRDSRFYHFNRKGSYGGFWLCKLGFIEKNCSSFPLVGKNFCRKNLHIKTPSQTSLCETKTTDPTGRRIKKSRIYGKQEKSSVKLQLPHLSNPHKIKNLKITAIWKQRYYRKQKFM